MPVAFQAGEQGLKATSPVGGVSGSERCTHVLRRDAACQEIEYSELPACDQVCPPSSNDAVQQTLTTYGSPTVGH